MSCSSRNPIAVSISLQYFKSKKYAFHCHKQEWSLSIIQMFNETTIMESHCIDEA